MFDSLRSTKNISLIGVTAALYIAITHILTPISFGPLQLRFSEILVLLAVISPIYGIGVSMGVFIANLFGPFGLIDAVVGTSSTILAVILISKTKNLLISTFWPTITAALFVGPMLSHIYEEWPVMSAIMTVGAGQFVVLTCLGYPVLKLILRDKRLYSMLKI